MIKRLLPLSVAVAFLAASAVAVYAFDCKVKSIEGSKVVLKCKSKDAKKLVAGQQAKVKKKIEGC